MQLTHHKCLAGLTGLLLIVVCWQIPEAAQVRVQNLEELTHRATNVIWAKCLDTRVLQDDAESGRVEVVRFAERRSAKGSHPRLFEIRISHTQRRIDPRPFQPGDEVVLFLSRDPHRHLVGLVGSGQGTFHVGSTPRGGVAALNSLGNRHLFQGLSADATRRLEPLLRDMRSGQALDPDLLVRLVERLAP